MPYSTYLRKSRADLDLERAGGEDTLARHRRTLAELADRMGLEVTAVYEEVVSGDSIVARPQMQRLLQEVEQGLWEGVLVMEVERLARGDTMDQGLVAQAFKYSGTKIITPMKTYDPSNEYDEEYFEFGLFMSRREYKTINRRLQAGKNAAMREGKFVGSIPPLGYDKVKLRGQKGQSLRPNADADLVRMIFDLYLREDQSLSAISHRLNDMGLRSPRGYPWSEEAVKRILQNPHYAGFTSNAKRPTKKVIRDGKVTRIRPTNPDLELYKALHEPLVSEADYRTAQKKLIANTKSHAPRVYGFQNQLNGLVHCDQCGRTMHRLIMKKRGSEYLLCPNRFCCTVMHSLPEVESLILDALRKWYVDFTASDCRPEDAAPQLEGLEKKRQRLEAARTSLAQREKRTYELLEECVYTPQEFTKRRAQIAKETAAVEADLKSVSADIAAAKRLIDQRAEFVPRVKHVLDVYTSETDKEKKNRLLKSVLKSVTYHKTIRSTKKDHFTDLSIEIFPLTIDNP